MKQTLPRIGFLRNKNATAIKCCGRLFLSTAKDLNASRTQNIYQVHLMSKVGEQSTLKFGEAIFLI